VNQRGKDRVATDLGGGRARGRRRVARLLVSGAVALLAALALPVAASAATFGFTGEEQTYGVPAGVTALHVVAIGAAGRSGSAGGSGGAGAAVAGTLAVTPGQTLYVEVGGVGECNGSGLGGSGTSFGGGAGGGASDVRTLSVADGGGSLCNTQSTPSLNSRLIVAGGGGGDGGGAFGTFGLGGAAGQAGTDGVAEGGQPGTATAGGSGGMGEDASPGGDGTLGQGGFGGGSGIVNVEGGGGGGGGGLYGGGGGAGGTPRLGAAVAAAQASSRPGELARQSPGRRRASRSLPARSSAPPRARSSGARRATT
jgi:hypothetical protein